MLVVVTIVMIYKHVFYQVNMMASDILCQKPSVANNKIFIIAIDDKTLKEYGSVNTWDRELSARLVEILNGMEFKKEESY